MPLPILAVPLVPDVPVAPGVPALATFNTAVSNVILLQADAAELARSFLGPQWGVFAADGTPVLIGDSVVAFDYRREYKVSDYPLEQGAFASYDKVQLPCDVRVTFASSGNGTILSSLSGGGLSSVDSAMDNRATFLLAVESAAASLTLFNVVTPEVVFQGFTITHADYRRSARNGVSLIQVEVWLEEIRVTATAAFTNTAQPSGASPQSGGTAQPTAPTPAQSNAAANGVASAAGSVGSSTAATVPATGALSTTGGTTTGGTLSTPGDTITPGTSAGPSFI